MGAIHQIKMGMDVYGIAITGYNGFLLYLIRKYIFSIIHISDIMAVALSSQDIHLPFFPIGQR